MSDNSDDETNGEYVSTHWQPYSERLEWRDVRPIEQNDGPNPIVSIAYSPKFVEVHNYFRAILDSKEKSERALDLTAECIMLNAANYTVWQYRRDILKALGVDLKDELKFIELMTNINMKNYQVWHHRKVIVEWMQDPSSELKFTSTVLLKDAKNYHAWQHRQWVMTTFDLFENELEYVDELLTKDIRNNSAWNQRYFVLNNTTQFEEEVIDREVDFTIEKILDVPDNESAWNYLRGILDRDQNGGLPYNNEVLKMCKDMYNDGYRINHLLACIIDICEERHSSDESKESLFHIDTAFKLCTDLAKQYDKIRKNYWEFRSQQLLEKFNSV
ncbi:protein farnesyltransferase/geranylgeranyltransferase type-1 subunit alpha [Copidosoma floridanum]|uniref:protein farnesyltransferase/geranylgeranyltransferase type-1 subunit alpha n=1 Tax=Copidosoma floridanum TaxID=29053 RepID=UPI0006C97B7E|nr:protein farnesyltransferase/geranylgeranyltransferase type-1 subunit alpha [Copidosoma floridanum]